MLSLFHSSIGDVLLLSCLGGQGTRNFKFSLRYCSRLHQPHPQVDMMILRVKIMLYSNNVVIKSGVYFHLMNLLCCLNLVFSLNGRTPFFNTSVLTKSKYCLLSCPVILSPYYRKCHYRHAENVKTNGVLCSYLNKTFGIQNLRITCNSNLYYSY